MAEVETFAPCEVELAFGDGDYLFRLPLKQIAELQLLCGYAGQRVGIGTIYRRVMTGDYFIEDLHHTIRLGLIGGGVEPHKARMLCDNYVENLPKEKIWAVARNILAACVSGYEDPDKKKVGESGEEFAPTMDGSTSPGPTVTDLSATEDSAPEK